MDGIVEQQPIISVKNAVYKYNRDTEDEVTALRGVSFDIAEGDFVALVGANGSGKSTLARLLNALYVPDEGNVVVDGIDTLTDKQVGIAKIRRTVGVVFQNPDNQMVASIIEDDVAFGPENLGLLPRRYVSAWTGRSNASVWRIIRKARRSDCREGRSSVWRSREYSP